jgi:superoxide dismutase
MSLPPEIWSMIGHYLRLKDQLRLAATCHQLHRLFWREFGSGRVNAENVAEFVSKLEHFGVAQCLLPFRSLVEFFLNIIQICAC